MNDEERKQNFEKLKKFLNSDIRIKNSLFELAPSEIDSYDENSKIEYIDKLYKELRDIEFEFSDMIKSFGGNSGKDLKERFSKIRDNLTNFNYSSGDIRKLYQDNFSNMSEVLIEDVKREFAGYTFFNDENLGGFFQKSKTINELLHVFHSYVMNNEELMQSMPIMEKKENDFTYNIVLYGEKTELSKSIFNEFPSDLNVGDTDIISMPNKVFMMIKDRGHALTVEIDETEENNLIRYFVPKLCNREMIEQLPGIGEITQNGARGVFETSKEEVTQKLFDFIEKVPMDKDMIFEEYEMPEEEYDYTQEQIQEEQEEQSLFYTQDVRDMAMEVGENGRKFSSIEKVQQKMKEAIKFLQEKFKNIFSKEKDGDLNER